MALASSGLNFISWQVLPAYSASTRTFFHLCSNIWCYGDAHHSHFRLLFLVSELRLTFRSCWTSEISFVWSDVLGLLWSAVVSSWECHCRPICKCSIQCVGSHWHFRLPHFGVCLAVAAVLGFTDPLLTLRVPGFSFLSSPSSPTQCLFNNPISGNHTHTMCRTSGAHRLWEPKICKVTSVRVPQKVQTLRWLYFPPVVSRNWSLYRVHTGEFIQVN